MLVLNDEAHHLWDPGSAWNEAIGAVHESPGEDGGISVQLDFSATLKDNAGQVFKYVVCDTPLGEVVDAHQDHELTDVEKARQELYGLDCGAG